MNLEGLGWFSRQPKDYLSISYQNELYYGSQSYKQILNATGDVIIHFKSDFITIRQLPYPKGFLLYFSSEY